MKCPHCKEEIDHVIGYSCIDGIGRLEKNKVIKWEWRDPYYKEIAKIICPYCGCDLIDSIKYLKRDGK